MPEPPAGTVLQPEILSDQDLQAWQADLLSDDFPLWYVFLRIWYKPLLMDLKAISIVLPRLQTVLPCSELPDIWIKMLLEYHFPDEILRPSDSDNGGILQPDLCYISEYNHWKYSLHK